MWVLVRGAFRVWFKRVWPSGFVKLAANTVISRLSNVKRTWSSSYTYLPFPHDALACTRVQCCGVAAESIRLKIRRYTLEQKIPDPINVQAAQVGRGTRHRLFGNNSSFYIYKSFTNNHFLRRVRAFVCTNEPAFFLFLKVEAIVPKVQRVLSLPCAFRAQCIVSLTFRPALLIRD